MFADLMDKEIQPKSIDIHRLPEIEISDKLKKEIQYVLEKEENNYAHVFTRTAIVQTDKNYVFFSNQWLYLAVLCKKYAESLKPYGDFFDKEIRGKKDRLKIFSSKNYEAAELIELIPDEIDRERMIKFITGDPQFRPGKSLINGESARSTKDIFGSCVLKKISVPDSSSAYLGNLIYYLVKRPKLYDLIEKEVNQQLQLTEDTLKLPSIVKECAKVIVDCIYKIDGFKRINERFEVMEQNIKINTFNTEGLLPNGNWLRYMFARPSSEMYNPDETNEKSRVFEKEYIITVNGTNLKCKLTTEVAVWHCTRILNEEDFWKYGIVVSGGRGSLGEKRIRLLLSQVGIAQDMIEKIFKHIYVYWDRNIESRTESVHFQGDKKTIYKDVNASIFATNLGGEIVRWSIENIDNDLYKKEPYKRLWILGKPCIIKFKCRLSQMREHSRTLLIVEILKYFIVTTIYKLPYEFDFTGMTIGSVPPENILSIEEIENFIEIHEKYEGMGFYDELKKK